MKSPIFRHVSNALRKDLRWEPSGEYEDVAKLAQKIVVEHKEALLTAWMAETGLMPSESVLVVRNDGAAIRIFIEKKMPEDKIKS